MAEIQLENLELQMLLNNKETGFNYRERREDAWRENYELYRDEVQINRLTQRQSVNIPLMKTQLRTVLKDIDDMPVVVFENLDNDKEAEVFLNEFWRLTLDENNAEIQDIVDKKQDFFFGRTFDSWQITDGKIRFDIEDPEDMLVDRFMNPYNLDSSRFLIHTHIFKPLSQLESNPEYDQTEVKKLKLFFESQLGIIKAKDNEESLLKKNEKLADMGVNDTEDPVLGETYVELTIHYVFRGEQTVNGKLYPEQIWKYTTAEDNCILMKKPQEEIMGATKDHYWRNHYRYNSWGDDVDKQDFWTDGLADIVRVPNKVMNSWFSQLVENRTLRNFGMNYYNASLKAEGFNPSTFNPVPWGWYPVAGNPNEVIRRVDIPDLSESLDEMTYVSGMVEKATGATATQQGVQTERQITLGEVQLAQGEAKARTQGISKFYTHCWKLRAEKFLKLIEASPEKIDAVKIYKKGRNTDNIFAREVEPKDWMTESGYRVKIWSQDEKKSNDQDSLAKLNAVYMNMMDNPKVKEVYQRKLLEFADLKPDEVNEIMEAERQKNEIMAQQPPLPQAGQKDVPPQQPMIPTNQSIPTQPTIPAEQIMPSKPAFGKKRTKK